MLAGKNTVSYLFFLGILFSLQYNLSKPELD